MRHKLIATAIGGLAVTIYGLSKLGKQPGNDVEQQPKSKFDWTKNYAVVTAPTPTPRFDAPMFEVGDEVLIYNPYENGYYAKYANTSPEFYEISDIDYDEQDGVYRYRLVNDPMLETDGKWISEDWLSLPLHTKFAKDLDDEEQAQLPTTEFIEAERKIIGKAMDDMARKATVDMLLDRINAGDAEAERELSELITKNKGEESE